MEFILTFDTSLFYFFNITLANPFFDWIFPIITSQKNWTPIYLFLILFLIVRFKQKGMWIAIFAIVAVGLTDFLGNELKELIGRLRPCKTFSDINLLVKCGSGKAFPSLHSANNFALAFILTRFFKQNGWIFYTLATLIAISRVIVGVHYPIDILGGAVLGTLISLIILTFVSKFEYFKKKVFFDKVKKYTPFRLNFPNQELNYFILSYRSPFTYNLLDPGHISLALVVPDKSAKYGYEVLAGWSFTTKNKSMVTSILMLLGLSLDSSQSNLKSDIKDATKRIIFRQEPEKEQKFLDTVNEISNFNCKYNIFRNNCSTTLHEIMVKIGIDKFPQNSKMIFPKRYFKYFEKLIINESIDLKKSE
jgi:undecaprenyl-diphosphatase